MVVRCEVFRRASGQTLSFVVPATVRPNSREWSEPLTLLDCTINVRCSASIALDIREIHSEVFVEIQKEVNWRATGHIFLRLFLTNDAHHRIWTSLVCIWERGAVDARGFERLR